MYSSLLKPVLLFIAVCFWFGSFHVDSTFAKDDWNLLFQIPINASIQNSVKRKVSGYVRHNNSGLADVAIFAGSEFLAETNAQGYYETMLLYGMPYTLTPQRSGYNFTPSSISISSGHNDLTNQNFTAKQIAIVTISGKVIWYQQGLSNPLNLIPVEAYEFTDCYDEDSFALFTRGITDINGNYSISVPIGWCGYIFPFWETGTGFFPGKQYFYKIKNDQVRNFQTPHHSGNAYTMTVKARDPQGNPLPRPHQFTATFTGTNHASGTSQICHFSGGDMSTFGGQCSVQQSHGWIGEVTIISDNSDYSFEPSSYIMGGILSADKEFSFKATEK